MTEISSTRVGVSAALYERKTTGVIAQKNQAVQCARGVAALFVVLFHASARSGNQFGPSGWATAFDGRFALVGVSVFFTISGLLMAGLIQRTDPWRFLAHRIVRIYPPYLLAVAGLLLFIAGHLTIGGLSLHLFPLMLVPAGSRPYYLGVEWTLVFECTYYVALFLIALIDWQRYLNGILLFWLLLIAVATYFFPANDDRLVYPIYSIWLSPANVAFIGGLLIPWLSRMPIPLGTGVLGLCILMIMPPLNLPINHWSFGAVATLFIFDVVRVQVPQRALFGLAKLGDWSYALYLCHLPCILIVYHWWPSSSAIGMAWFTAVATALVVAAAFGMLDVRMYRYLKSAVDSAEKQRRRRLVNIYAGAFVVASLIALGRSRFPLPG